MVLTAVRLWSKQGSNTTSTPELVIYYFKKWNIWPVLFECFCLAKISAASLRAQVSLHSHYPVPCIQYINLMSPKARVLNPFDILLLRSEHCHITCLSQITVVKLIVNMQTHFCNAHAKAWARRGPIGEKTDQHHVLQPVFHVAFRISPNQGIRPWSSLTNRRCRSGLQPQYCLRYDGLRTLQGQICKYYHSLHKINRAGEKNKQRKKGKQKRINLWGMKVSSGQLGCQKRRKNSIFFG